MNLVLVSMNASFLRSALLVWISVNLRLDSLEAQKPDLNMLFLIPATTTGPVANRTASVIVVALNTIERRSTLHDFDVKWQFEDHQCSPTRTMNIFYDKWTERNDKPHVVFGGYCEKICDLLAITAQSLNVPFLAIGCRATNRRNHLIIPTYLTFDYYRPSAIPLVIALMETYNWKRLVILVTADSNSFGVGLRAKNEVEAKKWRATLMLTTMDMVPEGHTSPEADDEVELILDEIKKEARIILLALKNNYASRILILAQRQGMYNGEYAFIGYDLTSVEATSIAATEDEWSSAKVGLVFLTPTNVYPQLENGQFVKHINDELKRNYRQFSQLKRQTLELQDKASLNYAGDLYVALRVYALMVSDTLKRMRISPAGGSDQIETIVRNGTLLLSKIHEVSKDATANAASVDENLGMLHFDQNGLRIATWVLINSGDSDKETVLFKYDIEGAVIKEPFLKQGLTWPGGVTKAPLDEPKCGWEHEKCLRNRGYILAKFYIYHRDGEPIARVPNLERQQILVGKPPEF